MNDTRKSPTPAEGRPAASADCTVVVCSCDKYADLLGPFAALWRRFWPDCPFPLALVTETAPEDALCFDRVIACGRGGSWCSRLVAALSQIETPYVLMLCDDYYLASPVDTALMLKRLAQAKEFGAANLRLIPNPKPGSSNAAAFPLAADLMQYKPRTAYCIATQSGFWRRDFLAKLAQGKESIWEFERYGSFDPAIGESPLLVTRTKEFPFVDAVHKGHWEKFGVEVCRANGVEIDFSARGLPPLTVRIVEGLKGLVFATVPNTFIVRVQNALGLGAKEKRSS